MRAGQRRHHCQSKIKGWKETLSRKQLFQSLIYRKGHQQFIPPLIYHLWTTKELKQGRHPGSCPASTQSTLKRAERPICFYLQYFVTLTYSSCFIISSFYSSALSQEPAANISSPLAKGAAKCLLRSQYQLLSHEQPTWGCECTRQQLMPFYWKIRL